MLPLSAGPGWLLPAVWNLGLAERAARRVCGCLAGSLRDPANDPYPDSAGPGQSAEVPAPPRAAAQAHGLLYGMLQRQAGMLTFVDNFWLLGVLILAMVPLTFLMKKAKPQKRTIQ